MRRWRTWLLVSLAFCAAALSGWSAGSPVPRATVCVLALANLSPGGAAQEHARPLSQDLSQEFEGAGFRVLPEDQWRAEAGRDKLPPDHITEAPDVLLIGQKTGVDMAVSGFYWMDKDRVLMSVQCYDVKAGTVITGFVHTWRFNLGLYNSIHAEMADLVQRVVFLSAPRLITLKSDVRVDQITFTSPQEGMEVFVQGQKSAGTIHNGSVVFNTDGIAAGTPLAVEKRQAGYHTLWQTVIASPEVALTPLPRESHLSVEVDWTAGQLEGAGATLRWYPVPDWIMVNFSEYAYTQVPLVSGSNWPLHSDSELFTGLYLFLPPESGFRFGLGAGAGVILTGIPASGLPLYTDVYINLASIWAEWKAWNLPMFARIELKVPLGIGTNLLGAGPPMHWGSIIPPIAFGVVIPWL